MSKTERRKKKLEKFRLKQIAKQSPIYSSSYNFTMKRNISKIAGKPFRSFMVASCYYFRIMERDWRERLKQFETTQTPASLR